MKTFLCLVLSVSVLSVRLLAEEIPNRLIDYPGFLADAAKVGELRKERRVTEDEFRRMAGEPGTLVLDARSREKYEMLHLKGAVHLSLPDVTVNELARVIPEKTTRVLIYCNNNFENEPAAFASKRATASLNIYTFNTLYSYGYTNVYELGPLLDIKTTKLPLEGTRVGESTFGQGDKR
jgi:phage shock protein E